MKRISQILIFIGLTALLAGCSNGLRLFDRNDDPVVETAAVVQSDIEDDADAEEEDDTAAADDPTTPVVPGVLGETVASLGDPTLPGLWLETPLVTTETPGRVAADGGMTASVTLRPSGGELGSGSRISLAAMQALGVNLTSLVTLTVIAGQ